MRVCGHEPMSGAVQLPVPFSVVSYGEQAVWHTPAGAVAGVHGPTLDVAGPTGKGQVHVMVRVCGHEPMRGAGHVPVPNSVVGANAEHSGTHRLSVVVVSVYVAGPMGSWHVQVRVVVSVIPLIEYGAWLSRCPGGHARVAMDCDGGGAEHAGAHAYTGAQGVITGCWATSGPMGVAQVWLAVVCDDCGADGWYCQGPGVAMRSVPAQVNVRSRVVVSETGMH